ncbi:MAG: hypothetical protein GY757_09180 [bacterium]|nr:hypothetical protein [bacterium]
MHITGRVTIKANNQVMLQKSGASATGIGKSGEPPMAKKPVMYEGGVAGYGEEAVEPKCEFTIIDRDDVSLDALARIEGGTLVFEAANGGKVYTLVDATCLGNMGVTSGEGDVPVVFVGSYWVESP